MTTSSLATANNPGGGVPRKKSWKQDLRNSVLTGAAVGLSCAAIIGFEGTWGNYLERTLVKTEARMLFDPGHAVEAKVLHGGKTDPSWICWGPGHPVPPFPPDRDMPPSCIEPTASFPVSVRPLVRDIYGGTDQWGPPHPCVGLHIATKVVSGEGVNSPPHHITEWVIPAPE